MPEPLRPSEGALRVGLAALMSAGTFLLGAHLGQDRAAPVAADAPPDPIVARWDGGAIDLDALEQRLSTELRDMDVRYALERFDLLQRTLEAQVEHELLEAERKRRGLPDVRALLDAEVDARAGEPGEFELLAAYERLVEQMPNVTYVDAMPQLRQALVEQRRQARQGAFVDELRAQAHLTLALPYPEIPRVSVQVRDHDAQIGPSDAAVTLVEFTEYPCQFCRRLTPVLDRLQADHAPNVRVVVKDFPVSGHPFARQGAIASRCAGEQGRYWEMHRGMMGDAQIDSPEQITSLAARLGLDMAAWSTCVHDDLWQIRLDQDQEDGRRAGVAATPTLFVNGLQVTGAVSYALLDALIDQEIARAGRAISHAPPP
ncbi:MAG TPA: DsbA family protein, partial [Myxococcota bacterium]|nr:DsbA family protein [Myxococcota bacterium]